MAWEWSHTAVAYENARMQLEALPPETVAVILAEWLSTDEPYSGAPQFDERRYARELRRAYSWLRRFGRPAVNAKVWAYATNLATCTNGGWEAWLCPHGCGCHLVPFAPVEA